MTETPILKHLNFTKLFILYTNTSKKGIDTILIQHDLEVKADYVVKYFSCNLGQVQEN